MASTRFRNSLIAAVLIPAMTLGISAPKPAEAKNNSAAVVGGIIAGAAVGAMVSNAVAQPRTVYVSAPPPPQPWAGAFSPRPGVNCYPAQRACYYANGAYNANWTWKVYAN
jgi:hypothetical protein